MQAVALFPVVVTLVGLVLYFLSERPKVAQVGLVSFGVGLLVTCFSLAKVSLHIG